MKRFKICPKCKEKNEPSLIECINCGTDLTGEPSITEEQYEASQKKQEEKPAEELVRICENCGAVNPANARKCSACGDDISYIVPVKSGEPVSEVKENKGHFVLASADGSYAFTITEKITVIGRENAMEDYLTGKAYTGRKHCEITAEDGKLFINDLNSTNGSFVNNIRIIQKTELKDGDEIGLGGIVKNGKRDPKAAYFIVSVNPCI